MVFQWYFNGAALSGATNASITLSGVDPTQAGTYEAVVSNPAGVASSQPARLTVAGVELEVIALPGHSINQVERFLGDREVRPDQGHPCASKCVELIHIQ